MKIKSDKIEYKDIATYQFEENNCYKIRVNYNNVNYNILVKIGHGDKVYIFPTSIKQEFNDEKTVFQRENWVTELDNTVIYINDPTPSMSKIANGFGHGSIERYFMEEMSLIVNEVLNNLCIGFTDVRFFATGPAAFIALSMGTFFRGSKVIVNNPIFFINNYYDSHIINLLNAVYKSNDRKMIVEKYASRFDIIKLFKVNKYMPSIISYHNGYSTYDNLNQLEPYVKEMSNLKDVVTNEMEINIYFDNSTVNSVAKIKDLKQFIIND